MHVIFEFSICVFIQFFFVGLLLTMLAFLRRSYKIFLAAIVVFSVFYFDALMVLLPRMVGLSCCHWNWEGKFLEFLWPLVVVYLLQWMTEKNIGLQLPKGRALLLGIMLGVFFTIVTLSEMVLSHSEKPINMFNLETLLFQFTMPGLAEELVFRGVLLAILNKYLGFQWRVLNTEIGWGSILVMLAFVSVHVIQYHPGEQRIIFKPDAISFDLIFLTGILTLLREKTGSLWPGILCHNIANALPIAILWML